MEGNIDYALLKAIESGAGLQFILSYRNTANLKEDDSLSNYYSIKYDIWLDDLVALYGELNSALKDVQTSVITEHTFLDGTRVPDNDELLADTLAAIEAAAKREQEEKLAAEKDLKNRILTARNLLKGANAKILAINSAWGSDTNPLDIGPVQMAYNAFAGGEGQLKIFNDTLTAWSNLKTAEEAYNADPSNAALRQAYENAQAATNGLKTASYELSKLYEAADETLKVLYEYTDMYETAAEGLELMIAEGAYEHERAQQEANLAAVRDEYLKLLSKVDGIKTLATDAYAQYHALYPDDTDTVNYEYGQTDKDEIDDTVTNTTQYKYQSDANKIVYEEYSNGVAFILNFNDYAVVVTNPKTGITYTIEAYGYVVLKPQTNA